MDTKTENIVNQMIAKHSLDALRIIVRLVQVGLSKGEVCTDDLGAL